MCFLFDLSFLQDKKQNKVSQKSFYDVKRKVLSKLILYFYGINLLFLRKLHCFPLWFHKSWKRTVSVALGIQKTKRKREKPEILKLSIKLVQEFPWHCFPGGNQSPITRVWMGTHCWSCLGRVGVPAWLRGLEPAEAATPLPVGPGQVCVRCAGVWLPNPPRPGLKQMKDLII